MGVLATPSMPGGNLERVDPRGEGDDRPWGILMAVRGDFACPSAGRFSGRLWGVSHGRRQSIKGAKAGSSSSCSKCERTSEATFLSRMRGPRTKITVYDVP